MRVARLSVPLRRSARGRIATVLAALAALVLAGCSVPGRGDVAGAAPVPPSAVSPPPPSADPATKPEFERFYGQRPDWRDCDNGFQCADVVVPVDWSNPAGSTIQLAVIRRKATGQRIGSLLMNPGGPGVSGVDFLRMAASRYGSALRASFDLVSWDPRGVAGSAQLDCVTNETLEANVRMDPSPDDDAERAALIASAREFAAGCAARSGDLLGHVDTLSTVKDMDVLRAVLGDRTLSYFGASYGTFLGSWYAQTFPWRVGRLVLDGAIDPSLDAKGYVEGQATGFARAVQAYLESCLGQQSCPFRGSVDDAKSQLKELIDRSDARPLPTSGTRDLPQALLVVGLIQGLYSDSLWPQLNKAITQAMQGDGTTLLAFADAYLQRDEQGQYGEVLESNTPIFCVDHPESRSLDQITADADDLGRRYPLFGEVMGWGSVGCLDWPVKPALTPQRLSAEGAAPILVVGTTGDPATPYEWSRALATQLSSARLLTREGTGHTGYGESECVDAAVEAYLVRGTLPAEGTVCR